MRLKNHIDICGFLKTGCIEDGVKIGADFNKFEAGQDTFKVHSVDGYTNIYIWKHFVVTKDDDNLIFIIDVSFRDFNVGTGDPFKRFRKEMKLTAVIDILVTNNISWSFESRYTFNDQLCIRTEGKVDFLFGKNGRDVVLYKIAACII